MDGSVDMVRAGGVIDLGESVNVLAALEQLRFSLNFILAAQRIHVLEPALRSWQRLAVGRLGGWLFYRTHKCHDWLGCGQRV